MLLKAWLFFFIHVVRYLPLLIHVKKNTIKNNILIGLDTAADTYEFLCGYSVDIFVLSLF